MISIEGYRIERISKQQAQDILSKFHYLSQQGFSFRSGFNYGLFYKDILIGVAIYHTLSVPETAKGCFGLERTQQQGIYELGRLAIDPNYYRKNLTSWFLSRTIKMLRKETNVRAILSYADSDYHVGYIYIKPPILNITDSLRLKKIFGYCRKMGLTKNINVEKYVDYKVNGDHGVENIDIY